MRRLLALLGLFFLAIVAASFLSPVAEFVRANSTLTAAEEQLQDAERLANQAAREFETRQDEGHRARYEEATRLVRVRLEECRDAQANRAAARRRLGETLAKWIRLLSDSR